MIDECSYEHRPNRNRLLHSFAIVIHNFPTHNNAALLDYAHSLGVLSNDGITSKSNNVEDSYVHSVSDRETPASDPFGNVMISTTHHDFPLHTDEYFSPVPAQIVLLLCVRPSLSGGQSNVAFVNDFVEGIGSTVAATLREPIFPSQSGPKRILSDGLQGTEIQFNELEIRRAATAANSKLDSKVELAIAHLRSVAEESVTQIRVGTGDCLLLNNKRALHGRAAFDKGDRRLLKRVRIK